MLDSGLMAPTYDGAFFSAVCLLPPKDSARVVGGWPIGWNKAARVGDILFDCSRCLPQTPHLSPPLRCNAELNSAMCRWEREGDGASPWMCYRKWILDAALLFPTEQHRKMNYLKQLTGRLWAETRFISNLSILQIFHWWSFSGLRW